MQGNLFSSHDLPIYIWPWERTHELVAAFSAQQNHDEWPIAISPFEARAAVIDNLPHQHPDVELLGAEVLRQLTSAVERREQLGALRQRYPQSTIQVPAFVTDTLPVGVLPGTAIDGMVDMLLNIDDQQRRQLEWARRSIEGLVVGILSKLAAQITPDELTTTDTICNLPGPLSGKLARVGVSWNHEGVRVMLFGAVGTLKAENWNQLVDASNKLRALLSKYLPPDKVEFLEAAVEDVAMLTRMAMSDSVAVAGLRAQLQMLANFLPRHLIFNPNHLKTVNLITKVRGMVLKWTAEEWQQQTGAKGNIAAFPLDEDNWCVFCLPEPDEDELMKMMMQQAPPELQAELEAELAAAEPPVALTKQQLTDVERQRVLASIHNPPLSKGELPPPPPDQTSMVE
jgi:hypothetical protein